MRYPGGEFRRNRLGTTAQYLCDAAVIDIKLGQGTAGAERAQVDCRQHTVHTVSGYSRNRQPARLQL
jgi:hypothetical protein